MSTQNIRVFFSFEWLRLKVNNKLRKKKVQVHEQKSLLLCLHERLQSIWDKVNDLPILYVYAIDGIGKGEGVFPQLLRIITLIVVNRCGIWKKSRFNANHWFDDIGDQR